jgi:putative peptidoglycan lipid II flippase
VLLSYLSDDFGAGSVRKARGTVHRTLISVCGILGLASFVLYLVRAPLLRFVFLRGQMDSVGVDRMIEVLPYHLIGVAPFGALLVLARAHVALKNSRIMISMGLLNAGMNLVFDLLLLKVLGLRGIALSTSLVHTAIAIVFYFRLEARLAREGTAITA